MESVGSVNKTRLPIHSGKIKMKYNTKMEPTKRRGRFSDCKL
jgi:hypothetical protein